MIGVVGAAGAVGRVVTNQLVAAGHAVRAGARRSIADVTGEVEMVTVDIDDAVALARFCSECRVVVNCAGPSYRIVDRVARAAFAVGASYVDPGGDDFLAARLDRESRRDTAILSAGLMPGLTGLLPRWMARNYPGAETLTAYVCVRDHLTRAGAADYLLTLGHGFGESLAAIRDGVTVSRALQPLVGAELPCFPEPVTAHPFLSRETERMARRLGLRDVSWYNVFDGPHLMAALGRHQDAFRGTGDMTAAVAAMMQAAELDMFGAEPYQRIVLRLESAAVGSRGSQTLCLDTRSTSVVTGVVAAYAAGWLMTGDVSPGIHFADEVLPLGVVEVLRAQPARAQLQLFDGDVVFEEGTL